MNEDRLDLLWDICAFLGLPSDLGTPILRTVARVGVGPIKGYCLEGVVVLRPLGVRDIELSEAEDVVPVLSPGLMDALSLCPGLGRVQAQSSQVVAYYRGPTITKTRTGL
jgi:hypothetical protein